MKLFGHSRPLNTTADQKLDELVSTGRFAMAQGSRGSAHQYLADAKRVARQCSDPHRAKNKVMAFEIDLKHKVW